MMIKYDERKGLSTTREIDDRGWLTQVEHTLWSRPIVI